MTSAINAITFDCHDHEKVGRFWADAMGLVDDPDDPNNPGDPMWHLMTPDDSTHLLFIPVPEPKTVKNRVHLDLWPTDCTRDEEVERLLGLGATIVADHRSPDGSGFVHMHDVEGNDFCVVRSEAERG